eukprot:COSAG06_NODE_27523_length_591_cov_1.355691_2_plen_113_part_00
MRKADLLSAVTTALSRSRKEIKAEWKQMKGESPAPKPTPKKTKAPKQPTPKKTKAPKQPTKTQYMDDEWHKQHKDTSGQAQANRVTNAAKRIERRAAVQRDMARVQKIRGKR